MSPASSYKISSDLVISSWNLLTNPYNLVQSCQSNAVVDSKKTKGKTIANFRVGSASGSEAGLSSAENSKASSNVGGQSAALTATCSPDHLDTEHSKYDTDDKISRQTRLLKSKKPETINSVALSEDKMCNNDFNVKGDLVRHTKTHDTKRSFQCDICGRKFNKSFNLTRHEKTHSGEHPCKCDICERKFGCSDSLKRHANVHTGERPFKCEECGKKFTQKGKLTEHKRIHTGERPFKCETCGIRFFRSHHLIEHQRTHTYERSFTCNLCLKRFTRANSLSYHIKIHSADRPLKCPECGKGFQGKTDLNNHELSHSSIPPLRVMRVMPDFDTKVALNVMYLLSVLRVKNSRIKPTENPEKDQVKDAQPTGIQSSLDLTTTMKNLLKVRIVMQA